jgi:hypothetical protein
MKASELRIGNLLEFRNYIQPHKLVTVGCRFFSSASVDNVKDADFEINHYYRPIKIDSDWLVKFGFKEEEKNMYLKPFNDLGLKKLVVYKYENETDNWNIAFADYYTGKEKSELLPTEIQHIHQLQNLWFCLVGCELVLGTT